ncbi:MAG: hypothetical protein ABW252_24370 [Polyangiales bacterium]
MLHPREVASWLAVLRNAPPKGPFDAGAFWSLFSVAGVPLAEMPASLRGGAPVPLLIVITTYQRPGPCAALLGALHDAIARDPQPGVRVLVLRDAGDADYGDAQRVGREAFGDALTWLDARQRLGKPGFWKTYQVAFLAAEALAPAHALFLQDDVAFAPTFVGDALARFASLAGDSRRRVLYLHSDESDEPWGRWTLFRRRDVAPGLRLVQWFDLQAFLVDRAFFTLLGHRMVPVHPNRWRRRPTISSGVGQQLTLRLRGRANVYQTSPPLVHHGALQSEMNPEARAKRPLGG